MDFSLNPDQVALQESLRRFLSDKYALEARRALATEGGSFDASVWTAFAEFGWLGATLSEDAGGLGLGAVEALVIQQEAGRALLLEPLLPVLTAARVLDRFGAAPVRAELLPAIAEGTHITVLAHAEPGLSSHLPEVATQARRVRGDIVLNGSKCQVLGAPHAHSFIASARWVEEGAAKLGLFKVDAEAAGLQMRNYTLMDDRAAADIVLSDVRLPADACVVEDADEAVRYAIDDSVLSLCAEAIGTMDLALGMTGEYLKTRQQFGQPIGKFQALQHRMADMYVELEQARSMLYRGLAAMQTATPRRRALQLSGAKALIGQASRFVGGHAVQLHGGIGMTDEYAIGHCLRRLIAGDALYGNAEAHLERVARAMREDSDEVLATV